MQSPKKGEKLFANKKLNENYFLRHKNLQNTQIYIAIERTIFGQSADDEFTIKVAKTLDEACSLLAAGFEYVTDYDDPTVKIFKKRK